MATRSNTMQDALENLGVRPDSLTQQEKDQLDHEGFLPLSGILTPDQLGNLRAQVDELLQAEGDRGGSEFRQEAGTERLSDLVNKARCSTSALRIRACWPASLTCWQRISSCPRSTTGRLYPDKAIRRSTQIGVSQSPPASFGSVTRSGCWTTSLRRMDQRAWCRARTGAARCRRMRCRTRPRRIRMT